MNDLRQNKTIGSRLLDTVERVGNKLPHPFMLFLYLAVAVILFFMVHCKSWGFFYSSWNR